MLLILRINFWIKFLSDRYNFVWARSNYLFILYLFLNYWFWISYLTVNYIYISYMLFRLQCEQWVYLCRLRRLLCWLLHTITTVDIRYVINGSLLLIFPKKLVFVFVRHLSKTMGTSLILLTIIARVWKNERGSWY